MTLYTPEDPRPEAPTPLNVQAVNFLYDVGYTLDEASDYHSDAFGGLSQLEVVDMLYTTDMHGEYHFTIAGEAMSRQNGKGETAEGVELFDAVILGGRVLRTAHEVNTALDAMKRLWDRKIEPNIDLSTRISAHRLSKGQEAIEFTNGGAIYYRARTRGGGRGLEGINRQTYDEAQHIKGEQLQASSATSLAADFGQTLLTGSPALPTHEYWYDFRIDGIRANLKRAAGDRVSMLWNEHTAQRFEGMDNNDEPILVNPDPDDREAWKRANPGFVHGRIKVRSLEKEQTLLTSDGFLNENLGVWFPPPKRLKSGTAKLSVEDWQALIDADSKILGRYGIAVASSFEQGHSTVVTYGWRKDGKAHIEVVAHQPGSYWVTTTLGAMIKLSRPHHLGVDISGSAKVLQVPIETLAKQRKLKTFAVGKNGVSVGCAALAKRVDDETFKHLGTNHIPDALLTAKVAAYGENGWRFVEHEDNDSSPLVAAALAALLVEHIPIKKSAYSRPKLEAE